MAVQVWKERQLNQADLQFWQEVLETFPQAEPAQITFLRNLFPSSLEATQWLSEHFPQDSSALLTRSAQRIVWMGNRQLSQRLLDTLNADLIDSEDAKIHRRFLIKTYENDIESNLTLTRSTLDFIEQTYPMTRRASRFLAKWAKELDQGEPKKSKGLRFPWRPLALGLFLSSVIIFLIYVISSQTRVHEAEPAEVFATKDTASTDIPTPPADAPPTLTTENSEPSTMVEPTSPPETPNRVYTVKSGDVLWRIALEELGSADRWREIQQLNQSLVPNPDYLLPGWILSIPTTQGTSQ